MNFRDLFVEHAAAALERQLDLGDRLGGCDWRFDMQEGTMTFETPSEALTTPVQVLGSEADRTASWVWVWGTEPRRIPEGMTRAAQKLRARGEKDGIRELKTARFPLTDADGETLGLVASGLLGAPGYYRAPFQGGAMIVLLEERGKDEGPPLAFPPEDPGQRITQVFPRVVDLLKPAEHRQALTAYARHHGFAIEGADVHSSGAFRATRTKSGEVIVCTFGADGSVRGLDVERA
jgi:hypothetical protein